MAVSSFAFTLIAFNIFSVVKGAWRNLTPTASYMALVSTGRAPLIPISAILCTPTGFYLLIYQTIEERLQIMTKNLLLEKEIKDPILS